MSTSVAIFEPALVPNDEVVALAFELWERAGCPENQVEEFMLSAEHLLGLPPRRGRSSVAEGDHPGIAESTMR